jgi:hypothetical protein
MKSLKQKWQDFNVYAYYALDIVKDFWPKIPNRTLLTIGEIVAGAGVVLVPALSHAADLNSTIEATEKCEYVKDSEKTIGANILHEKFRLDVNTKAISARYDFNGGDANQGKIFVTMPENFSPKNTIWGLFAQHSGNDTLTAGTSDFGVDIETKIDSTTTVGLYVGPTIEKGISGRLDYAAFRLITGAWEGKLAGYYYTNEPFKKGEDIQYAIVHEGETHNISIASGNNEHFFTQAIFRTPEFATLSFVTYKPEINDICVRTQLGLNPKSNYFSNATALQNISYFGMEDVKKVSEPVTFTNACYKFSGPSISFELDDNDIGTRISVVPGYNFGPVAVGIGVETYKESNATHTGIKFEMNTTPITIFGVGAVSVNTSYNGRTETVQATVDFNPK